MRIEYPEASLKELGGDDESSAKQVGGDELSSQQDKQDSRECIENEEISFSHIGKAIKRSFR